MVNKTFTLSGQEIRWSFWQGLVKLTGDRELAERMFLRAQEAHAKDIVGWIRDGIGRGGYCWNACARETTDPGYCRKWIDEHFHSARPGPKKVNAVLVDVLQSMLNQAKGG